MTEPSADGFRTVDSSAAVADGTVVPHYLSDRKTRIAIARVDGHLYAFNDLCTCDHQPCPLSGGLLTGTTVMCQCHGSRFDVTTGAVVNGPATDPLHLYDVQEADGCIQLRPRRAVEGRHPTLTRRTSSGPRESRNVMKTMRSMRSGSGPLTPLRAVAVGLAAGTLGTLAMDLVLYARYRRGDGESGFLRWEFSADVHTWDEAPAPAQVGKRLYEGLFRRELPESRAALVNNLTHWGYGIANGVPYGLLAGSVHAPRIRYGAPFGAGVWASSYLVLPAAGLYEPIWKYDGRVLAKDLSAHLVYGLSTAAVFRLLVTRRKS